MGMNAAVDRRNTGSVHELANRGYFAGKSAIRLGHEFITNEVTSQRLVELALESIEQLNPHLNAFVHVDAEAALRQAGEADLALKGGTYLGPLHGIPIAIKDVIDTVNMPTTYGSRFYADHWPAIDAVCVTRLKAAGAVIIGKTHTSEFALGPTGDRSMQGPAHNPWDVERVTGGSSSGSAAAVASGMVPLAIGTDTAGSIRIPSALCGTVGFKPTYGSIDNTGVFPVSATLDHVGPISKTVEDAALVYRVLADPHLQKAPSLDRKVPRIGWLSPRSIAPIDRRVEETVFLEAKRRFEGSLEHVPDASQLVDGLNKCYRATLLYEACEVHRKRLLDPGTYLNREIVERLSAGLNFSPLEYEGALAQRLALQAQLGAIFETYDILLLPSTGITAPLIDQRDILLGEVSVSILETLNAFTRLFNVLGLPAVSVPAGFVGGLPVGLQAVSAYGTDLWLLNVLSLHGW